MRSLLLKASSTWRRSTLPYTDNWFAAFEFPPHRPRPKPIARAAKKSTPTMRALFLLIHNTLLLNAGAAAGDATGAVAGDATADAPSSVRIATRASWSKNLALRTTASHACSRQRRRLCNIEHRGKRPGSASVQSVSALKGRRLGASGDRTCARRGSIRRLRLAQGNYG